MVENNSTMERVLPCWTWSVVLNITSSSDGMSSLVEMLPPFPRVPLTILVIYRKFIQWIQFVEVFLQVNCQTDMIEDNSSMKRVYPWATLKYSFHLAFVFSYIYSKDRISDSVNKCIYNITQYNNCK